MVDAYSHAPSFFNAADDGGDDDGFLGMDDDHHQNPSMLALASTSSAVSAYLYSSASVSSTPFPPALSSADADVNSAPSAALLDTWRVPPSLFTVFVSFYAAVFFCGLVGNTFVVAAIALNKTFRTATDWLISSLAIADLLILVFCLPSTLLNNLLTEWQLGSWGCKLSVWVNSTTSCASIFTLVGVTGDRYLAICHPLRQLKMKNSLLHLYIFGIWLLSALMASPNLWVYRQILYDLISGQQHEQLPATLLEQQQQHHLVARLCVDTSNNIWLFIVINLLVAFLVPIVVICVLYALIFRAVSRHTRKKLAVDNGARIRDERVKLRIAQMMFTVIVVFVLCWTPLYALYCYFFMAEDRDSMFFQFSSSVLRPIFQWLSLLSSSLNPLIYIAFSQKYRRAFHSLLLFPCRRRYKEFKQATRSTFRRSSCFSEKPSTAQLFSCQLSNNNYALRGEESVCANYMFSNPHRNSTGSAATDATAMMRQHQQRKVSFSTATGGPPATRRKMSEQQQQHQQQQQQQQHRGWRPSPPASSSCWSSSLLTTTSCDGGGSGMTTLSNNNNNSYNGGAAMVNNNLLRRVALENSQRRQWWRKKATLSSGECCDNNNNNSNNCTNNDSKKHCGDAERRRRQWREAVTASPQRRLARESTEEEDNASDSTTNSTPRRQRCCASNRTRSADPLLRVLSACEQQQSLDDESQQRTPPQVAVAESLTGWR